MYIETMAYTIHTVCFLAEMYIENSKSLKAVLCFAAGVFPRANKNIL